MLHIYLCLHCCFHRREMLTTTDVFTSKQRLSPNRTPACKVEKRCLIILARLFECVRLWEIWRLVGCEPTLSHSAASVGNPFWEMADLEATIFDWTAFVGDTPCEFALVARTLLPVPSVRMQHLSHVCVCARCRVAMRLRDTKIGGAVCSSPFAVWIRILESVTGVGTALGRCACVRTVCRAAEGSVGWWPSLAVSRVWTPLVALCGCVVASLSDWKFVVPPGFCVFSCTRLRLISPKALFQPVVGLLSRNAPRFL